VLAAQKSETGNVELLLLRAEMGVGEVQLPLPHAEDPKVSNMTPLLRAEMGFREVKLLFLHAEVNVWAFDHKNSQFVTKETKTLCRYTRYLNQFPVLQTAKKCSI